MGRHPKWSGSLKVQGPFEGLRGILGARERSGCPLSSKRSKVPQGSSSPTGQGLQGPRSWIRTTHSGGKTYPRASGRDLRNGLEVRHNAADQIRRHLHRLFEAVRQPPVRPETNKNTAVLNARGHRGLKTTFPPSDTDTLDCRVSSTMMTPCSQCKPLKTVWCPGCPVGAVTWRWSLRAACWRCSAPSDAARPSR